MHTSDIVAQIIFLVSIFWMGYMAGVKLGVRRVWKRARADFDLWYDRNPGVYVAISPHGKELLFRLIYAYHDLEKKFPWYANEAVLNHYKTFLNDFPPKTPFQAPTLEAPPRRRFFLYTISHD